MARPTTKKYAGVYPHRTRKGEYYIVYDGPCKPDGSRDPKTEYYDAELGPIEGRWTSPAKAFAYRALQIKKVKEGKYKSKSKIKLREYLETWLREREDQVAPLTLVNNKRALRHFIDALGNIELSKLEYQHVKDLIDNWVSSGNNKISTIKKYLKVFNAALNAAVEPPRRLIDENPAKYVKIQKQKNTEEKGDSIVVLSPDEIDYFLKLAIGHRYEEAGIVYFYSGARRGEVLGLRRDQDIDFENNTVTFAQQVISLDHKAVIQGTLKTKNSYRTISLDEIAMNAIRRAIRKRLEEKLRAGSSYVDNGLVFANEDGTPVSPDSITDWFDLMGEKIGRPDFNVHGARHTHITLLLANGVPPLTVSKRVGNTVTMTLETYGHYQPQADKAASDQIAQILRTGTK